MASKWWWSTGLLGHVYFVWRDSACSISLKRIKNCKGENTGTLDWRIHVAREVKAAIIAVTHEPFLVSWINCYCVIQKYWNVRRHGWRQLLCSKGGSALRKDCWLACTWSQWLGSRCSQLPLYELCLMICRCFRDQDLHHVRRCNPIRIAKITPSFAKVTMLIVKWQPAWYDPSTIREEWRIIIFLTNIHLTQSMAAGCTDVPQST